MSVSVSVGAREPVIHLPGNVESSAAMRIRLAIVFFFSATGINVEGKEVSSS
jgi:hypothetical protein